MVVSDLPRRLIVTRSLTTCPSTCGTSLASRTPLAGEKRIEDAGMGGRRHGQYARDRKTSEEGREARAVATV